MSLKKTFCLSGRGQLEEITWQGDTFIACIKVITPKKKNAPIQDAILLYCEVPDVEYQSQLEGYISNVSKDTTVYVTFKAEYSFLRHVNSGMDPKDPSNIVLLQGRLRALGSCFINGKLVKSNHRKLKATI